MSEFRTLEVSDPRFESNQLRFITVKSQNINGRGDICTYVPQGTGNKISLPIVILLHGVYGSSWSWAHQGGVHLLVDDLIRKKDLPPMILAMPSDGLWGDGSAYLPHNGKNFEKWIVEDVVKAVVKVIPGAKEDSPLFIAGLSMGGFGALRIGAKYGSLFKGISGHSSITNLEQMKLFVEEDLSNYTQKDLVEEDVFKTIQNNRNSLPPLRFDCGTSDMLIEYNRLLHLDLQKAGIDHDYKENPGSHQWAYWEKHISESLFFFAEQLLKVY